MLHGASIISGIFGGHTICIVHVFRVDHDHIVICSSSVCISDWTILMRMWVVTMWIFSKLFDSLTYVCQCMRHTMTILFHWNVYWSISFHPLSLSLSLFLPSFLYPNISGYFTWTSQCSCVGYISQCECNFQLDSVGRMAHMHKIDEREIVTVNNLLGFTFDDIS